MGATTSVWGVPDMVDEDTARKFAGHKFDQQKFQELAVDGKITKAQWLHLAANDAADADPDTGKGKYVGQWKNGHYEGKGTFDFADGSHYTGQWQEIRMHGLGVLKYADGRTY